MRRFVAVVILIALLLSCAYMPRQYLSQRTRMSDDPIVISDNVGEAIDALERVEFGLFSIIEDFEAAEIYELADGGYEILITTTKNKLRIINKDPNGIRILKDYIDSYKQIMDSEDILKSWTEYEKKWEIVDYDELELPITREEIKLLKEHYFVCLGCAGGCMLLLIPSCWFAWIEAIAIYDPDSEGLTIASYLGYGSILSAAGGAWFGNRIDEKRTIDDIKRARRPRVVEEYDTKE